MFPPFEKEVRFLVHAGKKTAIMKGLNVVETSYLPHVLSKVNEC
jgi:hypothetical protein